MSSSQEQIWYLLVLADGTPFKNCTPAKVPVSSTADIDDLRNAVKLKNRNKLGKVDSSDLKVFKIEDELNEDPILTVLQIEKAVKGEWLKNSRAVTALGQSEENPLLVLVPELHPQPSRSLISHALPPLGPRELSCSVSKTRVESAYQIQITAKGGSIGILDDFTRDKLNRNSSSLLWTEAKSGALKPWSGETDISRL